MRVLIIEPDKLLADNLSQVLKAAGHEASWQVDLQAAVEDIEAKRPQAIVLDLFLARRSGLELIYELRSYPDWQNIPIIIWSQAAGDEIQALLADQENFGPLQYHHKPAASLSDIVSSLALVPA